MNTTIICPHCKKPFEISDAIQHQIKDELLRAKTEQSETLRKEYDAAAETKLRQAVQAALTEANQAAQLQLDRERQAAKLELDKARQSTELETERLRREAAASKESEKQLREQLKGLLEELSKANKAREDAELAARKELLEKEKGIRAEAAQKASEDFNTKIREQEETINRLREQLTTAKQVAEQGSQQLQGEILELDIEEALRSGFPFDTVDEVKKGERGSDIRQVVNEQFYMNCGLILWECKNAKIYQASWLGKLKDELAAEKAQIGVIVFNPTDGGGDDFKQLADNIWLVKPRYVIMLATLLREAIVKVFAANRAAEGKDVKVELIYNYLTGGEFSNRIRYILESYDEMAKQLDTEKKQAQKRWAAQEKILQKVTSSLYGMSGDLQGIAGREIIALPALGDGDDTKAVKPRGIAPPKQIGADEDEY
ncbi:DUF2130 domain-containing protein [Cloacibacillus sp.]|uniref:DUF2130 domain-containing protein n=1 Tax=Cloacibacillus sp. TaxID=2049023 RepID=UPI0025BB4B7A|nr:DUF2130 domain-containing protein [Cloacibacillus sp.]MCC8056879.1 DUF2130 domain-containing protein [Cloacibacillus sp.]